MLLNSYLDSILSEVNGNVSVKRISILNIAHSRTVLDVSILWHKEREFPIQFGIVQKAKDDAYKSNITEIGRDHPHLTVQKVQKELNMNKNVFKIVTQISAESEV
jgi:hypothetical protein